MNFDIMSLCNTTHANKMALEALLKYHSIKIPSYNQNIDYLGLNFSEIFPIKSEEELVKFEQHIKENELFRDRLMAQLKLVFGSRPIRTCIQYVFDDMFEDEILLNYTIKPNRNLKDFCKLETYNILFRVLRQNKTFKSDWDIKRGFELWMQQSNIRAMARRSGVLII